jgi:cytochrome P450
MIADNLWIKESFAGVQSLQIAVYCTLLFALYLVYNLYFHPLRNLPGPWTARAGLPSPFFAAMAQRRIQFYIYNLHEKYGHTVRYSANRVSTVHKDASAILYSHSSKYIKSSFYDAFSIFEVPNVFSCRNIKDHSNIRRSVSSAFTLTSLVDLEEYVDSVLQDLTDKLDAVAQSASKDEKHVDMAFTFQAFAMDVVGELGFGKSFGLTKSGTDPTHMLVRLCRCQVVTNSVLASDVLIF